MSVTTQDSLFLVEIPSQGLAVWISIQSLRGEETGRKRFHRFSTATENIILGFKGGISSWWFQSFFIFANNFHSYLGKIPILTNIFQLGWNHQLVCFFLR